MKHSRFNLRDLFWLVLVVGLALGWWVQYGRMGADRARLEAALSRTYKNALVGKPLADAMRDHQLEVAAVWSTPNLPPDAEAEATYFLDEGNLTLKFSGEPPTISEVDFRLSDRSVEDRVRSVNEGWNDWVQRHSD